MDNSGLIEKIKAMGFSDYEAKCYLAMFERESLTVSEVANLAKIPRPNTYDALEKLQYEGLVVLLPGKIMKYTVVDPEFLKEKQLERLHRTTNNIQNNIEAVTKELGSFFLSSRSNNKPLEYVEIIKDRYKAHQKFMNLCAAAKKEVIAFNKPPYACSSKKERDDQIDVLSERDEAGVIMKTIVEIPEDDEDKMVLLREINEEPTFGNNFIRFSNNLPIKMIVIDGEVALFIMKDRLVDSQSITAVVVEDQSLALSFKMLFQFLWNESKDYMLINNRKHYCKEKIIAKKKTSRGKKKNK
jgi:sugar-specific transcriptional regulator TrmB